MRKNTCSLEWLAVHAPQDNNRIDLIDRYEISISRMSMDLIYVDFVFFYHRQELLPEMDTHIYIWVTRQVFYQKEELLTLPRAPGYSPDFCGSVLLIFIASVLCVCLQSVSCMPNVFSLSGLSILDNYPFSFL